MKSSLFYLFFLVISGSCNSTNTKNVNLEQIKVVVKDSIVILPKKIVSIQKSDEYWKSLLSPDAYYVLREKGTERSFTGKYWDNQESGIYCCAACMLPLFKSDAKFESGTGWPSFYEAINPTVIREIKDNSHLMVRTETVCSRCGGHLGHVFDDGPQPTGLRYCMNSISLTFIKNGILSSE